MYVHQVRTIYSESFDELRAFFQGLKPPYTLGHIRGFNAIYRETYPLLSREERIRAENFVDQMIEGLEDGSLASKIFGVV